MQAPSLIIPVKTQTKFKQWLELLSTNSFGRAQLLHVKLNFGEKKTSCFSKFEQCSNCGQNGVLSSYKMYLKYLDYVCSVNGGLNIRVLSVGVAYPELFLIN